MYTLGVYHIDVDLYDYNRITGRVSDNYNELKVIIEQHKDYSGEEYQVQIVSNVGYVGEKSAVEVNEFFRNNKKVEYYEVVKLDKRIEEFY